VGFDGSSGIALPRGSSTAAPLPPLDDQPELTEAERTELAVLPAACSGNRPGKGLRYPQRGDQLLTHADLANLHCCSECHNANSDTVPSAATMKVSQHCQICHNERTSR
jgi:hypothetical protein